jgi:hypothetical protein
MRAGATSLTEQTLKLEQTWLKLAGIVKPVGRARIESHAAHK